MSETCAQLQTRLDGYVAARDKIAMGRQVVKVGDSGHDLSYAPVDGKRLDILIREVRLLMERQRCDGCRRRGGITYLTPSG